MNVPHHRSINSTKIGQKSDLPSNEMKKLDRNNGPFLNLSTNLMRMFGPINLSTLFRMIPFHVITARDRITHPMALAVVSV